MCAISFYSESQVLLRFRLFFQGLRDLGYVDGKNLIFDIQGANEDDKQFSSLAAQCVANRSDVIVVMSTPAAQAAMQATSSRSMWKPQRRLA